MHELGCTLLNKLTDCGRGKKQIQSQYSSSSGFSFDFGEEQEEYKLKEEPRIYCFLPCLNRWLR